jgi:hypothetical protein
MQIKKTYSWTLVAQACNPSYLGGWDGKDHGSRSAGANSLGDPNSKTNRTKWIGGMVQVAEHLLYLFKKIIAVLGLHYKNFTLYHSWIHSPSIIFLYPPYPHSWNSFNRSHFSIYIHVYKIFAPYSPSYTLSLYPLPSHWYHLLGQDLFCFPVLHFCKKNFFVCSR